jgi:hypothetical protein
MSAAVGADIESMCAKCGDVWHVVVAMVGTKVAKVQCKQCGGYHRHKATEKQKAAAALIKKPRAAKKPSESSATRAPAKPVIDPDKPIKAYRMSETFAPGDQIQHLRFGVGVVEAAGEPGKIAVLFDEGRKVLAAAKAAGGTLTTANDMVRAARRASDQGE